MSDLLIRNIDAAVLENLSERAKARGQTAEDEARRVLSEAARHGSIDINAWLEDLRAFRDSMPAMPIGYSSQDALREGRTLHHAKRGLTEK